jgi:hypothetical protein
MRNTNEAKKHTYEIRQSIGARPKLHRIAAVRGGFVWFEAIDGSEPKWRANAATSAAVLAGLDTDCVVRTTLA